jgi:hypothetical protein
MRKSSLFRCYRFPGYRPVQVEMDEARPKALIIHLQRRQKKVYVPVAGEPGNHIMITPTGRCGICPAATVSFTSALRFVVSIAKAAA